MVNVRKILCRELIKNGYSESGGNRVWNIANRSFLHLNPESSKRFLDLYTFAPYRKNIYERELKLIRKNVKKIIKKIGTDKSFNLIDIGCGNGEKAKEFLRALDGKVKVRYCPVSPDNFMIKEALKNIKTEGFKNIVYKPYRAMYSNLDGVAPLMRSREFQKNVILLHGSILGSYEINDYLFNLGEGMFRGGYMIIGNGMRTGRRPVNLKNYRHPIFAKLFIPLMKELGFKENELEYGVRFNNTRIEWFFKVKKDKSMRAGLRKLVFNEGDEILVAMLYKYYFKELNEFFNMYFSEVDVVRDPKNKYALALCKK